MIVRGIHLIGVVSLTVWAAQAVAIEPALVLAPEGSNSRNSEGDFIQLADGRVLFVYTHFTSGTGDDFDTAYLAGRQSEDGGATWSTEDTVVLPNEGTLNTMSVSLLRLADGAIGLLYLRKNGHDDCRPFFRVSRDEAQTWSEPVAVSDTLGYYVVNNDRMVQLQSGRLLVPTAIHAEDGRKFSGHASALCFLSDDDGTTWRRSATRLIAPAEIHSGFQEPGVVEFEDGSLLMLIRTSAGVLYESRSTDGGDTWSPAAPTDLKSPVSPATVERIPATNTLLLLWNNHADAPESIQGKRTPLTAALSDDGGRTWHSVRDLEDDPHGWYCYTAMEFVDDHVLLGYCAGDRRENNGLALTKIVRLPLGAVSGTK
jgi:sialidase-1